LKTGSRYIVLVPIDICVFPRLRAYSLEEETVVLDHGTSATKLVGVKVKSQRFGLCSPAWWPFSRNAFRAAFPATSPSNVFIFLISVFYPRDIVGNLSVANPPARDHSRHR